MADQDGPPPGTRPGEIAAPPQPRLVSMDVRPPDPSLVASWNALDDDAQVSLTKGEITHLMNTLSSLIASIAEGQNASYWAQHQRLADANESMAAFRSQVRSSMESFTALSEMVMARQGVK